MPQTQIPVITIDGPTASGKGTVAHLVAEHFGFHLLDSGALYRLTALQVLRREVPIADEHAIAKLGEHLPVTFKGNDILLANESVVNAIRAEDVGNMASKIAAIPVVRQALYALQLSFRKAPGLVADGRDMGTVIFPNAQCKVFMTASAEARAQRRYKQLIEKGFPAKMEDLLADLQARDARDMNRAVAPLAPAEDAHLLDTSHMTALEAADQVIRWYAQGRHKH